MLVGASHSSAPIGLSGFLPASILELRGGREARIKPLNFQTETLPELAALSRKMQVDVGSRVRCATR
jgi:hypothetical protein